MSRRRFYVPRDSIRDGIAVLSADQAHHLRNVLRLGTGDVVEIFDGEGSGYTGEVQLRGSKVVVRALQRLDPLKMSQLLILAAALIKPVRFEWMLQKATELGVSEIIPVKTLRTGVQIRQERVNARLQRWDRIIKEAAKQSGRFDAPRLKEPVEFSDFLSRREFSQHSKILFHKEASQVFQPEKELLSENTVVCVGPEGGWEPDEIEKAERAGFRIYSLGPLTLRAETAAIVAVALIQHQFNLPRK